MIATGKKLTVTKLGEMPIADLKGKYDAADLCASAYANPRTPMPLGVRKVLSVAHGELLKRQEMIRLLRSQLSHANAYIDDIKSAAPHSRVEPASPEPSQEADRG